jgi:hypothetical protein
VRDRSCSGYIRADRNLTDEEKEAVLRQRLAIWTWSNSIDRSLLESLSDSQRLRFAGEWADDSIMMPTEPGSNSIDHSLLESWSDSQRLRFASEWADDSIMMPTEQAECQTGEGKRPVGEQSIESPAKRPRAEEYFAVKSVKHVNVRKFRTTGTDFFLFYITCKGQVFKHTFKC